ncbi:major facilitator superfamily domain-containing protein 12-like [Cataglyphis hispanica]|uniref:major facilitator superfamily domain-containing protein 12-like n=1 Tax=Cataglyphis hispanica TaxID=1086592 RepID=UPI00217F6D0A|nr:major facilitator superfamily domain-containing protein 12-like [Cataglyphis hispanica]XP_050458133.1 major facilitator superfamily domain-containing protein 12-like [Cataglyphis hispanica]XP_050458134.1 major facilitator superfamily domain-containing protein 12-like [Cataglyphis hispanica]XP_050458135.1 major facilitator superfamily domain-containing protein 12-like [Cataglyphis hispanica]
MEPGTSSPTDDYTEIIRKLPVYLKLAYGTGHVLNDICASMWFTYLLVFFHLVLGFDPTLAGAVLLIGQVADALVTPFVGFQSDRNDNFWLCRYGRRKTWHLIGTICVLLGFPFIFSQCIGCEYAHQYAQLVYYAAFVVIFQFGWAAVQISHLALVPELTPSEHERTELIAIRFTFTVFSNVLVYCIMWGVLHVTSDAYDTQIGPGDIHKFQKVILIGLVVGLIASIIFHVVVKEGANGDANGSFLHRNGRTALVLLRDFRLYQIAFVYMLTRLFINLCQIYMPLYLHESLNMPATSLAYIPLTMYLSSFLTSLIIERLNTKWGRKIAYSIGALLAISACIWIQFGNDDTYTKYQIYAVAVLLGSAGAIMLVTSLGITSDLIGRNTESGAFAYGIMSFTDKLSNGLVVMLIQYLVKHLSSGYASYYYRNILTYVCGVSAASAMLMILYIKPFSRDMVFDTLHNEEDESFIETPNPIDGNSDQQLQTNT